MKTFLLLLFPGLLLALTTPQPAFCSWFREQIALQPVTLPQGISLDVIEASPTQGAGIRIENQTSGLLFVLSTRYQEQLTEPASPDPDYDARLRFAHEVASYLVPPDGERPLSLGIPALLDLDPALQDPNRVDASRPSAEELALPAAQDSLLLMVHAEQVLRVPFTISYSLNPDYDPAACGEQTAEGRTPASTTPLPSDDTPNSSIQRVLPGLLLLFLVAVTMLGTSLLARRMRT